jgi:hypothetical protein
MLQIRLNIDTKRNESPFMVSKDQIAGSEDQSPVRVIIGEDSDVDSPRIHGATQFISGSQAIDRGLLHLEIGQ